MADDIDASTKGPSAWAQAVAALALGAALCVGLWTLRGTSSTDSAPPPARCSDGESEKAPAKTPGRVAGVELCEALNRPGLAELLGTPGDIAKSALGSDPSVGSANGKETATPSGRVELGTYTVTLTATYDNLPVAGSAALLGVDAQQRAVLGRPAVLYSQRTISIRFRLDGSDTDSGPGLPARVLTVSQDAKDSGGSFDVAIWREDGQVPDDAVLLRLAEKVLPTVPGWAANR